MFHHVKFIYYVSFLFLFFSCNENKKDKHIEVNTTSPYALDTLITDYASHDVYEVSVHSTCPKDALYIVVNNNGDYTYANVVFSPDEQDQHIKMRYFVSQKKQNIPLQFFVHYLGKKECQINRFSITKLNDKDEEIIETPYYTKIMYDILKNEYIHQLNEIDTPFLPYIEKAPLSLFHINGFASKKAFLRTHKSFNQDSLIHLMKMNKKETISVEIKENSELKIYPYSLYSSTYFYNEKDSQMRIHTNSEAINKTLNVYELVAGYKRKKMASYIILSDTFSIPIVNLPSGFYELQISDSQHSSNSVPLVKSSNKGNVIILAPLTTWHAYNTFTGKSLYKNYIDSADVNFISTQVPINSVDFDSIKTGHDIFILKNIYDWFNENYGASIYPDYYLQQYPELFTDAKTIVLAQHCEYFSAEMYKQLKKNSEHANIISMGGNQIYWSIKWHKNFTQIESHKNGNFYNGTLTPGGLWRNALYSEASFLGNAFTDAGYSTYAPYKLLLFNHDLLSGISDFPKDSLFGHAGIDNRGISGDEMDKTSKSTPSNAQIIAKGTNPDDGGGEIVYIERYPYATLSLGSIASGSGLGSDELFTRIIENFMQKHHKPLSNK